MSEEKRDRLPEFEETIKKLEEIQGHFRALAGISQTKQGRAGHLESARSIGDALALLKAQEAVRPIRVIGRWIKYYACGACKKQLGSNDSRDSYCRHCGRPVKWE